MSRKKATRAALFALAILLSLSIFVPTASARGSNYILTCSAIMSAGSSGNVTASFWISGNGTMDQIGAISVDIYENGTLVKTFSHTTTAGMMASNTSLHYSSVTYTGIVGQTYYACVTFQAGKNGGYDNRSINTSSVTAKN